MATYNSPKCAEFANCEKIRIVRTIDAKKYAIAGLIGDGC